MLVLVTTSFLLLMTYAAFCDLRAYTLPNWISLALTGGFLAIIVLTEPSWTAIGWHVAVAVALFFIGFVLFAVGQFGGGDVKMIAALGLWLGPNNVLAFFLTMSLIGGVMALMLLAFRRVPIPQKWQSNASVAGWHSKNEGIPYGVAIAIAAAMEFPNTLIFEALSNL